MQIVALSCAEARAIGEVLVSAADHGAREILVATTGSPMELDDSFKLKINGGIWSPPLGKGVK